MHKETKVSPSTRPCVGRRILSCLSVIELVMSCSVRSADWTEGLVPNSTLQTCLLLHPEVLTTLLVHKVLFSVGRQLCLCFKQLQHREMQPYAGNALQMKILHWSSFYPVMCVCQRVCVCVFLKECVLTCHMTLVTSHYDLLWLQFLDL